MIFLDNFSDTSTFKVAKDVNNSYHIFIKMIDFYKDQIDTAQYMNLFYFHNLSEKCLAFLRKKEYNSAQLLYTDLNSIDRKTFPSSMSYGIEANYSACIGYQDYVNKRYDSAIKLMETAISSTIGQAESMSLYISSLYELNLNILRIHIKDKNVEKIIDKLSSILESILFNQHQTPHFHEKLSTLTDIEKTEWLNHVLNNALFSISEANPLSQDMQNIILLGVTDRIINNDNNNNTQSEFLNASFDSLNILFAYLKGNLNLFTSQLNQYFNSWKKSPFYVRKMLLANYISSIESNQNNLVAHINNLNFVSVLKEHNLKLNY